MENEQNVVFKEDERGAAVGWTHKGKLVRCKDCLYHTDAYPYDEEDELIPINAVFCQHFEVIRDKEWYCADGERKDGEQ